MNIVSNQNLVNFVSNMNSYPSQNESIFSYSGNVPLNGDSQSDPYGDMSNPNLHQAVPFDNDSLIQQSSLYFENVLEHTDDTYLHENFHGEHDELIDPQWGEKETMILIELVGTVGFDWIEIAKRMNKNPDDCQKRYDLVIKVFESKPSNNNIGSNSNVNNTNFNNSSSSSIESSLSSSSSPIQSPTINSSVPSPEETDNTSSDDKFDGSRRRKSTSTAMENNLKKRHRRTASEIDRSYKCLAPSCSKSYGTEGALKMHIKLKHPGIKIPQLAFSPTLTGQFYQQRILSPHFNAQYMGNPVDLPKELIYNAQAAAQNPYLPHSYPQLPTFPKQRPILPSTSLSAPSIPTQITPNNLQPISAAASAATFSPSSSSDLQSTMEPFMQAPNVVLNGSPPSQVYRFSDLPSISLKIGSWEKQSQFCGDLVARFSYTEHKFMWEIYNHGESLTKMEILFDDVCGMEFAPYNDDRIDVAFLLKKPPLFYEAKFGPNQQSSPNMTYKSTTDFTGGEALQCKKHTLCFIKNALSKPLEALTITDHKFRSFIEASNLDISTCTLRNNNNTNTNTNNNTFNNLPPSYSNIQQQPNINSINNGLINGNTVFINPSIFNTNFTTTTSTTSTNQQQPQQASTASTASISIPQQQLTDSPTICTETLSLVGTNSQNIQQQQSSQQPGVVPTATTTTAHDYLASSHQNISIPIQLTQSQSSQAPQAILTNSPSLSTKATPIYNIPQHSLNSVPTTCLDLLPEQPLSTTTDIMNGTFNSVVDPHNNNSNNNNTTPLFNSTELGKRFSDNLALCSPLMVGQSVQQPQQHQSSQQQLNVTQESTITQQLQQQLNPNPPI